MTTAVGLPAVEVVAAFRQAGVSPFVGVPCSCLGPLIRTVLEHHPDEYLPATNEGEAVAVATGLRLAGARPAVFLQNSGLGNALNPLTSLTDTLRVPVLLLVTWRGEPGSPDEPQHRLMGSITPELLGLAGVRHEAFPDRLADLTAALDRALRYMDDTGRASAFVVSRTAVAAAPEQEAEPEADLMLRAEAIATVAGLCPPDTLLVSTTGKTSRELERDADRAGNLYVVGSMGCASSIALGVALGAPRRRVVVLDGDGAALMRLEAMATIGSRSPRNLVHLVLDNAAYESTGAQPTVSPGVDFCGIATACGYRSVADVADTGALRSAFAAAGEAPGPHLIRVRIRCGSAPGLGRPATAPPDVAARFAKAVAG